MSTEQLFLCFGLNKTLHAKVAKLAKKDNANVCRFYLVRFASRIVQLVN